MEKRLNNLSSDTLQRNLLERTFALRVEKTKSQLLAKLLKQVITAIETRRRQIMELNKQLEEQNKELDRLNKLKNETLGIVAHDLRNPLGNVLGFAKLIADQKLGSINEQQAMAANIIEKNCAHMLEMMENLLDITAIEAGEIRLIREPANLNEFMQESLENNRQLAQAKNINLTLELKDSLPGTPIDTNKMNQVLNNLISNGIKYSHPGSTVWLSAQVEDKGIVVSVRDEGVGIPEDEIDRVFHPFKRTSARPTAGEKSVGLGLAIVKKIIEAHGGQIQVKSSPQKGTTFTFTIPYLP